MKTSCLIILLLGITLPCFESAPQTFDDETESKLMAILKAAKGMKWNDQVEKGMETIIKDEEGDKDPEQESEIVKDEIAMAFKRMMMLDPSAEMTLKDEFRSILGAEKAETIFKEAEKIMWQELQEQARIDKELSLKTSQKKAFSKLVNDVEKGKDPLHERKKIEMKIKEDAAKILSLSPEDQEEEKDRFYAEYGEATGEKVFQAIKIIHEEAVKKAVASNAAQKELQGLATATS
ncbi:Hypp5966 [Branchiostoma lanceolatum]|uniref:Hypp5966 protein n=1 Tax=Branchiostoma lanceolatum TaxID=7740 RepID=A0A8J9W028_BRALA|nr:Hypp5966 [Branchiostoma lanceolatum]